MADNFVPILKITPRMRRHSYPIAETERIDILKKIENIICPIATPRGIQINQTSQIRRLSNNLFNDYFNFSGLVVRCLKDEGFRSAFLEDVMSKMKEGTMRNFIKCINLELDSRKDQDIETVKNFKDQLLLVGNNITSLERS